MKLPSRAQRRAEAKAEKKKGLVFCPLYNDPRLGEAGKRLLQSMDYLKQINLRERRKIVVESPGVSSSGEDS